MDQPPSSLSQAILQEDKTATGALWNTPVEEDLLEGTPLMAAAEKGRKDLVQALLRRGDDPNAQHYIVGQTALYRAAEFGHFEIAKLLSPLTRKDIVTFLGMTPLHIAAMSGHTSIVKHLLQVEYDANAQTYAKMTALACAAQQGHLGVMEVLLKWGAADLPDDQGCHALDHAAVRCGGKNHKEALRLLQDEGFEKRKLSSWLPSIPLLDIFRLKRALR